MDGAGLCLTEMTVTALEWHAEALTCESSASTLWRPLQSKSPCTMQAVSSAVLQCTYRLLQQHEGA